MKLSIITICYNDLSGLKTTVESVFEQEWQNFEYLIIDGGSTDGSVAFIESLQNKLDYWVSEGDKGVFNAMNKGIAKAQGEYLLMLNAGDFLVNNKVLYNVFNTLKVESDLIFGNVYRAVNFEIFTESIFPEKLTFNFFRGGSISHQGTFIKRELHEKIGLYDESLKYVSDWKFFILAVCKYNVSYIKVEHFITVCDATGLTCDPSNFNKMDKEFKNVINEHFPAFVDDYTHFDQMVANKPLNKLSSLLTVGKKKVKSIFGQ